MPLFRVHRDREHVINPRPDRGPCMHAPGQQLSARFARRLAAACLLVPKRHSELFGRQEVFVSVGAAQTSMGTTSQSDRAASGRRAGAARKKKKKPRRPGWRRMFVKRSAVPRGVYLCDQ
ncbi:hypothetical protein RRG08_027699 [Elysia crispata]|uniref:Uncharacterized protein n=1 Tax=Elysia crispata TaxID=231223 RepID=A0AAE0XMA7_9GAST|nr:hypothetical protein RRG08_027699 [Elysia crispata]